MQRAVDNWKRPYLSTDAVAGLQKYGGYDGCAEPSVAATALKPLWVWVANCVHTRFKPSVHLTVTLLFLTLSSVFQVTTVASETVPSAAIHGFCGVTGLLFQASAASYAVHLEDSAKAAGPLEVIFLQGCNAMAVGLFVLNGVLVVNCSSTDWRFRGVVAAYCTCYVIHWQKYVSGQRRLVSRKLDVTEIQLIVSGIHVITAIFGTEMWTWHLPFVDTWQLNHVMLLFLVAQSMITIVKYMNIILEGGPGEEGMTTADTAILSPAIPILLALLVTRELSLSWTFKEIPNTILVGLIVLFSKISIKLIVASVSRSPLEQLDVLFFPVFGVSLLQLIGLDLHSIFFARAYVAFAVLEFAFYWSAILLELSQIQGENIFRRAASKKTK
eukprot:m.201321 g.201321  ORF g.201321 m.201321 type:complete len:385 (-) comp32796_c4_seq9:399-1553(-)